MYLTRLCGWILPFGVAFILSYTTVMVHMPRESQKSKRGLIVVGTALFGILLNWALWAVYGPDEQWIPRPDIDIAKPAIVPLEGPGGLIN